MKRTASLNLNWKRYDEWDEWYANLPAIPGYYGTQTEGNAQIDIQPVGSGYGFDIFIIRTYDLGAAGVDHIHLDNRDFDIPDTETADEMKNIVGEQLTVEDIADALQAEGYMPNVDVTASRQATKREASLNLDWEPCDTPGFDYMAELPAIPGYPGSAPDAADGGAFAYVGPAPGDNESGYIFMLDIAITNISKCVLFNASLNIPNADTAEEMMNIVNNFTVEEIADRIAVDGIEPVDDTIASRKADKRTAHFDLDWEENNYAREPYYYADFPNIPGYTAPGYMTEAIVDTPTVDLNDVYSFTLMLGGINEGGVTSLNTVQLHSDDFGIPYRDTPEEAMQDLENLSMDDIIFVLQQEGCQPYEED